MNSLVPWLSKHLDAWQKEDPQLKNELKRQGGKAQLTKRVRQWPSWDDLRGTDIWTDLCDRDRTIPCRVSFRAWEHDPTISSTERGLTEHLPVICRIPSYALKFGVIPDEHGQFFAGSKEHSIDNTTPATASDSMRSWQRQLKEDYDKAAAQADRQAIYDNRWDALPSFNPSELSLALLDKHPVDEALLLGTPTSSNDIPPSSGVYRFVSSTTIPTAAQGRKKRASSKRTDTNTMSPYPSQEDDIMADPQTQAALPFTQIDFSYAKPSKPVMRSLSFDSEPEDQPFGQTADLGLAQAPTTQAQEGEPDAQEESQRSRRSSPFRLAPRLLSPSGDLLSLGDQNTSPAKRKPSASPATASAPKKVRLTTPRTSPRAPEATQPPYPIPALSPQLVQTASKKTTSPPSTEETSAAGPYYPIPPVEGSLYNFPPMPAYKRPAITSHRLALVLAQLA